jgi:hypothetical protein
MRKGGRPSSCIAPAILSPLSVACRAASSMIVKACASGTVPYSMPMCSQRRSAAVGFVLASARMKRVMTDGGTCVFSFGSPMSANARSGCPEWVSTSTPTPSATVSIRSLRVPCLR